jgi:hypothetical protein
VGQAARSCRCQPSPRAARQFRAELHACFPRRADALFELGDALLCAQALPSLPHLSLEPICRRGWGSIDAALARGRVDAGRLRDLLAGCLPDADPLVFAVDVITWPRCDAECSPERGYYYHPSRHSAGQPIVAGWAFQLICQLSFARESIARWRTASGLRAGTPRPWRVNALRSDGQVVPSSTTRPRAGGVRPAA